MCRQYYVFVVIYTLYFALKKLYYKFFSIKSEQFLHA